MATTFETFRDEQVALIAATPPVSFEDVAFERHRDEQPLRTWAAEHPTACLRRFTVRDLVEYEAPGTSTYDQEWVVGRHEVAIAYPVDGRYGEQNLRDLRDVMREDEKLIDERIGTHGYDAYTEGHCVRTSTTHEEGDEVSYLVMVYEFRFYRSR